MRLAFVFSMLCFVGISLTSYGQNDRNKAHIPGMGSSILDTSNIAILVFDQKENWLFENSCKPISLRADEIIKVDSLVTQSVLAYNNSLSENLRSEYSIDFKKYNYKRQFIAVI